MLKAGVLVAVLRAMVLIKKHKFSLLVYSIRMLHAKLLLLDVGKPARSFNVKARLNCSGELIHILPPRTRTTDVLEVDLVNGKIHLSFVVSARTGTETERPRTNSRPRERERERPCLQVHEARSHVCRAAFILL